MIVHLFDDQKFVDTTIRRFDNFNADINRYIVFSNKKKLKYVQNTKRIRKLSLSPHNINYDLIFDHCNLLVIHFLTPLKSFLIKKAPSNVKILWISWGADFYNQFKYFPLYESLTKKLILKNFFFHFRKSNIYNIYHLLRYRVLPIRLEKKILGKIDFLSTVVPYEFKLITNEFNFKPKYIDFSYGVSNYNNNDYVNLGNKVLIGNSATYSNNHLDIFEKIKKSNCEFICPINYGGFDFKSYQKIVIKSGRNYFKNRISFLTKYLSADEYDKVLYDCNTAIMFHIRQQALANIFKLLFYGVRIFLNDKSLLYKYLLQKGAIIFNLKSHLNLIGIELNEKEKNINKKIVNTLRGSDVIDEKYQNIILIHNA